MLFALVTLLVAGIAQGKPSEDLVISAYQLYPENIDYNDKTRLAYISVLYNSTVAVYDPVKNRVDPLGRLSVIVNAGAAFDTQGKDISGDSFLIKYDPEGRKEAWRRNLTAITNGVYSGFQDVEHDSSGNSFAVGTWPSSIVRVSADGKEAKAWYLSDDTDHTKKGLTGLASKDNILLASEHAGSRLLRFDMSADEGVPTVVSIGKNATTPIGSRPDGIYLPKRFGGHVLLVSSQGEGTVVLFSADGTWTSAELLGTIPNKFANQGGSTTASVQLSDGIYVSTEWFADAANRVPGTLAGNRTEFPFYDITCHIEDLIG